MIAFRYTKTDGAEYLSHLDLLRHVYRTLRRARIQVEMSEGFHAHPRIFLNNPLPVGVLSVAEYGTVDTSFTGNFKEAFNAFSPKGIKCADFRITDLNPNYANSIDRCDYAIYGITPSDPQIILGEESIVITDTRGREIDVRPRIYALRFADDRLECTLGCGGNNLRPDLFARFAATRFGGKADKTVKLAAHGNGVF